MIYYIKTPKGVGPFITSNGAFPFNTLTFGSKLLIYLYKQLV
jgi:hypothetical protein